VFDHDWMAHDRPGPDRDRLLVARISSIAQRHARWGAMDEAQKAVGEAELREIARDRSDLLAEVVGVSLGTAEGKGPEYEAQRQAVAELCLTAGADESLIPEWIAEGKRRAAERRMPPFSQSVRRTPGRS
jgi:hypothetical protein